VAYLLSCVQPDGGIYRTVSGQKGGGLGNYNTAICMTALYATRDKSLVPVVLKAREFVAATQHAGDDIYQGGFGYDARTGRAYTDMLNTFYSVEAMTVTAGAEELRPAGEKRADIDWKATISFLERMQNAGDAPADDRGGFVYNPTDPKGGTVTNAQGVVTFRSYGSITYAGMLSLIYANVNRTDPRVASALDWASRHWTLDENPGMGAEGLFFFYNILTRSLAACGVDLVPQSGGSAVDWRVELARKLISLQKVDPESGHGYWMNEAGRYWENNPVLVSSYALLALEQL
jgi:squalene-hopene/tetraprenyl-beta-curcumene cyclase